MSASERITLAFSLTIFIASCGSGGHDPDPNNPPPSSSYGHVGCRAASGGASEFTQILNTTTSQYYDQKFIEEIQIQANFFNGIPASVSIFYDGVEKRNAYSSPNKEIFFGFEMFWYTVRSFNELAVAGILAHEWGHQIQFQRNFVTPQNTSQQIELEADAWSGFYMALRKGWAWSQIQGYYANCYALGNYYFNDPTFHGTPNQRVAAAYLGVQVAIQNQGTNKSYEELHQIFVYNIYNNIIPYPDINGENQLSVNTLGATETNSDIQVSSIRPDYFLETNKKN